MQDVTQSGGGLITWEELEGRSVARSCRGAYNRAITNIRATPFIDEERRRKIAVYLQELATNKIWEFEAQANKVMRNWWRDKGPVEAVRTYRVRNGYLEKVKKEEPTYGSILQRVIIGKQKTNTSTLANKILYGDYYGELQIATQYEWRDRRGFFDTTTQHLRKLQAPERRVMHKSLQRWNRYFAWEPDPKRLWQQTWMPWRSARENTFLWQMLYWVPATQQWRFPKLPRTDDQTHCTRCRRN
jgi:hypothetical protein